MGIINVNKELSATQISCGDSFKIKLSLTAEPNIQSNPTDIVLIIDRSANMAGSPLANLKNGAKKLVDIIYTSTSDTQDGQIGGGSRMALVSFSDTAVQNTQLITSTSDLNTAIDSLTSGGLSNHADAFTLAGQLFDATSSNAKVVVMFTDGVTTTGTDPNTVATSLKADGVTIYIVGFAGNDGVVNTQAINDWASDPDSSYVAIAPGDAELETLFDGLAENITNAGATNIVILDTIDPCFKITSLSSPTKGTGTMISSTSVEWQIPQLGTEQSEGATFEFTVEHIGTCDGFIAVNQNINYSDAESNTVNFPSPVIEVVCNADIIAEGCPTPVSVNVSGCDESFEFNAGNISLSSTGKILQLDLTLQNVCPGRRVALAIILDEVDNDGNEYRRGFKTMTLPAITSDSCQNVTVRCINFVLPDDLDVSGSSGTCTTRKFNARFLANYVDSSFTCCTNTAN